MATALLNCRQNTLVVITSVRRNTRRLVSETTRQHVFARLVFGVRVRYARLVDGLQIGRRQFVSVTGVRRRRLECVLEVAIVNRNATRYKQAQSSDEKVRYVVEKCHNIFCI